MPQISYISQFYSNTIQNKLIRRRSEIFLFINFHGSISYNFTTNATQKLAESPPIVHLYSFTTKFIFLKTLMTQYSWDFFKFKQPNSRWFSILIRWNDKTFSNNWKQWIIQTYFKLYYLISMIWANIFTGFIEKWE